jgi:hypothetical protein
VLTVLQSLYSEYLIYCQSNFTLTSYKQLAISHDSLMDLRLGASDPSLAGIDAMTSPSRRATSQILDDLLKREGEAKEFFDSAAASKSNLARGFRDT